MYRLPRIHSLRLRQTGAAEGFTLIEILSVIALMGVLIAIAGPRIDLAYYRLSGAMSDVASRLFVAQRTALQSQHDVVVAFDASGSRIRIHQDLNNNHRVDSGEAAVWEALPEGIRFGRGSAAAMGAYSEAVSLDATQDGYPALTFLRNGSASEEAVVYLTSQRALSSSEYVKDARAIRVQRSTGRPTLYRYDSPDWERDL
jgi:prepilin-type N-terminal cleavage/methylation domain-containing protein